MSQTLDRMSTLDAEFFYAEHPVPAAEGPSMIHQAAERRP